MHVAGDLRPQRVHVGPALLRPQPLQKEDLHLSPRRDLDGMKVQQVALDGERRFSEGRTIAHIGDRLEPLAAHARARDINAQPRRKFVVARQIDGGHGVLVSVTASPAGRRGDGEHAPQQHADAGDVAGQEQLADVAARHRLPAHAHFVIDAHGEARLAAKLLQPLHIAFGLVSEVEVRALVHFFGVERPRQQLRGELARRSEREVTVEGQHQRGIEAGLRQKFQLARCGGEQLGRVGRPQDARRMRIEGHRHGTRARLLRAAHHLPEHGAVRAVHAIEVAHAHDGGSEVGGHGGQLAEYFHDCFGRIRSRTRVSAHHTQGARARAAPRWSLRASGRGRCG